MLLIHLTSGTLLVKGTSSGSATSSLIVAGPNANSNTSALQTTGSTALFYGAGGSGAIMNLDFSTFIPYGVDIIYQQREYLSQI